MFKPRDAKESNNTHEGFGRSTDNDHEAIIIAISAISIKDTPLQVHEFCQAIQKQLGPGLSGQIGGLEDSIQGFFHHFRVDKPLSMYTLEPSSLKEILFPGHLEEITRLELGVKIASAIMHLHTSDWLSHNWGCEDIFFLQMIKEKRNDKNEFVRVKDHALSRPFLQIQSNNGQNQQACMTTNHSALVEYDETLFCLGIVLIELWFQKPIEILGEASYEVERTDYNFLYKKAMSCVGELWSTAGQDYGTAVMNCIMPRGMMLEDTIKASLEDDKFKNSVHERIILPLQRKLEVFSRL